MLVGHAVSNYEGRSAFAESSDTSQLMESMTGQWICISLSLYHVRSYMYWQVFENVSYRCFLKVGMHCNTYPTNDG